ncbi:MAG: alpha-glucosidase [Anaerocolumna sp.]
MNNITKWWKAAVIYQIYPRSFQDSNGDGIGDIIGIINRLSYLAELGIDAIWLSPVYSSPQDDNGYDISDYQNIDPMFGTLTDMEQLIEEAGKRNIRIIMDLVLNHTSDEHIWFKEAKKSRSNPYHDYYIWRDGKEGEIPNNMRACFGGSVWEWVPEISQYYFHQFSIKQPDLNWGNPKVRQELYYMICWWMDKGVGGFRLDVIDQIAKEPDRKITNNGPRLHEFIKELSLRTFQKKEDIVTVGETWGVTPEIARIYSNPDGSEFSMVFQFEHIGLDQEDGKEKWDLAPLDFLKLKRVFTKWQLELHGKGWNSLFWNNHDLPRIVSRWGDDSEEYRTLSAKMLATLLYGMEGTPYIYQGEELGMTNITYPISDYRDIETLNMYKERLHNGYPEEKIMTAIHAKSRDNARTPMQWNEKENAGFTEGTPWINVNPNYVDINADSQINDIDSVFHYYQKLIKLRKDLEVFTSGNYELLLPDHPDIFAYIRTTGQTRLLVVCNFHNKTIPFCRPDEFIGTSVLINNYGESSSSYLRPYEALILCKC